MSDQGFWEDSLKWIADNAPALYAGLAAIGVSSMMNIKDGQPKKYTITSAIVCGIVATSLSGLLEHVGLPSSAAALVGGIIGFIGADKLRDIANTLANRRLNGATQDGKNENKQ
ncbi:phage holin, lambda family [Serratia sp. JSRIV001]|uniref:phage holin, lambda family n=1 Tax=Serratia sp. JSRIV001 TaxID=2831893 RepID=UPI001CC0D01E|nr:phage holin, lambda family [Serratia sp. JSRIV001]UAN47022.1 phage holin, lambda family [Serratia sp. JSRIV001]